LATSEVINLTAVKRAPAFGASLIPAGHQLSTCIQCGTCTASCPSAAAMDITPRQMWRMVQLGLVDEVLHSKTMWLCSVCYQCQARCPRGIPLTDTIAKLKQLAIQQQVKEWHESTTFYLAFAGVMRRYGRMREMEFMARYFMSTNPMEALGYATMGLTLFRRGKIRPEIPKLVGKGRLDDLFDRVAELEKQR
jgi:heterodisulfide reductase subunit C2